MGSRMTAWAQSRGWMAYSLALGLYIVATTLYYSTATIYLPSNISTIRSVACGTLLVVAELVDGKRDRRSLVGYGIIALLGGTVIFAKTAKVVLLALFCLVARNYDFRRIARVALWSMIGSVLVVVFLSQVGLTLDYTWDLRGRIRRGLGFRYTTHLSHYIFFATLLLIYLREGTLRLSELAVVLIVNLAVFVFTDSRNSFLLTMFALALSPLARKLSKAGDDRQARTVRLLSTMTFPVLALASVALMVLYVPESGFFNLLDEFVGKRIEISNRTLSLYGVRPFGQEIESYGNGLNENLFLYRTTNDVTMVDNSYCNVLINEGFVTLVVFVLLCALTIWVLASKRQYVTVFLLITVAIHSCIDPWWLSISYDVLILIIGPTLLGKDQSYLMEPAT